MHLRIITNNYSSIIWYLPIHLSIWFGYFFIFLSSLPFSFFVLSLVSYYSNILKAEAKVRTFLYTLFSPHSISLSTCISGGVLNYASLFSLLMCISWQYGVKRLMQSWRRTLALIGARGSLGYESRDSSRTVRWSSSKPTQLMWRESWNTPSHSAGYVELDEYSIWYRLMS